MSSKLSATITKQFTVGGGLHNPMVSRTNRGLSPSFADRFQSMLVTSVENVVVTIATPSLGAGATATISGLQGLQSATSLTVTSTDVGQTHIGNVSVTAPSGIIVSHPTLQITTAQGTPVGGGLAQGQTYTGLTLTASITLFAPGAVGAGTLTLNATVMVLGTALGN